MQSGLTEQPALSRGTGYRGYRFPAAGGRLCAYACVCVRMHVHVCSFKVSWGPPACLASAAVLPTPDWRGCFRLARCLCCFWLLLLVWNKEHSSRLEKEFCMRDACGVIGIAHRRNSGQAGLGSRSPARRPVPGTRGAAQLSLGPGSAVRLCLAPVTPPPWGVCLLHSFSF